MSTNQSIPSDPAAIEREIRQRQTSLASTVDELMERAKPKNVAEVAKTEARVRIDSLKGTAKARGRGVADQARGRLNSATSNARGKASAAQAGVLSKVKNRNGGGTGDGVAAGSGYAVNDAAAGTATSGFAGNSQAQARQAAAKVGLIDENGQAEQSRIVALAAGTTSAALFLSWLATRGR